MDQNTIHPFQEGVLRDCYKRGLSEKQAAAVVTEATRAALARGADFGINNPVAREFTQAGVQHVIVNNAALIE